MEFLPMHIPVLYFLGVLVRGTLSSSKIDARCGGCKMIIDELENSIRKVDPKKTVRVGSFRVDPKGDQYLADVPYARSETHLHELLDNVCDASKLYGLTEHPATGRAAFVRTENFDGQKLKFASIDSSSTLRSKLKFACESVLEDYEELLLLKILSKENHDALNQFCHKHTGLCKVEDFIPYPAQLEIQNKEMEDDKDEDDIHEL